MSPSLNLLTIDEPVLRRRARYTLYKLNAQLSHGTRDVWNGIRRVGNDGPRWNGFGDDGYGDGNGVSLRNDDAEPIWVFWDGTSCTDIS